MRIAIDAGHGLSNRAPGVYDPGVVAGGVAEADVALLWALAGRYLLRRNGLEVWLTRDDDDDAAPLADRVHQARQAGCTHLISLHCNGSADPGATGTETYYRDQADQELAAVAQGAGLYALGLRDRGLRREAQSQHSRLAVLEFGGPACLVELGFLSNPEDRRRLLERPCRVAFWERLAAVLRR